ADWATVIGFRNRSHGVEDPPCPLFVHDRKVKLAAARESFGCGFVRLNLPESRPPARGLRTRSPIFSVSRKGTSLPRRVPTVLLSLVGQERPGYYLRTTVWQPSSACSARTSSSRPDVKKYARYAERGHIHRQLESFSQLT